MLARSKQLVQILLSLDRTHSVGARGLIDLPKGKDSCLRIKTTREEALRQSNITLNLHAARVVNKREECAMVKARSLHDGLPLPSMLEECHCWKVDAY